LFELAQLEVEDVLGRAKHAVAHQTPAELE
jgi:hypothetical protein